MPIRFEWGFNNESISVLDNIKIDGTRRSSTLTIEAVEADNVGAYHCTATNKGGKETSSSELIVKGVLNLLIPKFIFYLLNFFSIIFGLKIDFF